ncbi:MAG: nucleoside 2-deoxyribosyltransferase [Methanomicrobiaceae archaeon]|nr:nucleoside 2-deoxyribosyltransferase [Methanomicrobiaceae archaeon]
MFILMCPCIGEPSLRAEGITKTSDIELFSRCIGRCEEFGIEIVYLPCPETIYLGRGRNPGSFLDNLNTKEFSALLERLKGDVLKIIEEKGKPLCIVGVDSSPSCGVNMTYYSDMKEKGRGAFLSLFPDIPAFDVSEFARYKVYFAAPLFSCAERDFNERLAILLREHMFLVHLPQELGDNQGSREKSQNKKIFEQNLAALDEADIVVSIIDGSDADSGTSWEMGYAYAKNKKIISLRTDFRSVGENELVNLMLEESSVVINSETELINLLNPLKSP